MQKLEEQERQKIQTWANATKEVASAKEEYSTFLIDIIRANNTIPVILTKYGKVVNYRNLDSALMQDSVYVKNKIKYMKSVNEPIEIEYIEGMNLVLCFENSHLLNQLKIYPYFQLTVIGLFLAVSYFAFSYSRRSEQNKVWAGMSKETAHQLGTPISSLIGWVDYLKESEGKVTERVVREIDNDVTRLQLITERFSKIGSAPVLQEAKLIDVLEESINYINSRTSSKVEIGISNAEQMKDITVMVNIPLFAWVIENLCKNAVDAMEGEGKIDFKLVPHSGKIILDVSDTGKGIPSTVQKTIFKPGYTTKKRGWGLGLSLVKRIIENYHKGKIFVKQSEIGKGTTFRIELRQGSL
ncbi:HAMP domain-containing histidine kinase [bacterium]|nr:HAMP domain-containing histidine kinase [bacterium]